MEAQPLRESDMKCLLYLRRNGESRPGEIGQQVYEGSRKPQCYARPATNMLKRLQGLGLVEQFFRRWGVCWDITFKGLRAAMDAPQHQEKANDVGKDET